MSQIVKNWTEWLKKSRFSYLSDEQKEQTLKWLFEVRDEVLDRANLKPDDTLIDIGTGTGLMAFGAYDILKDSGKVIASDKFVDCVEEVKKVAQDCGLNDNFEFLVSSADKIARPENSVDVAVMRSVLVHIVEKLPAITEVYRILKKGGRISIFEPIISSNTRYYELISPEKYHNYEKIKEAESEFMSSKDDPLTNFDEKTLKADFEKAGFKNIDIHVETIRSTYTVKPDMIDPWFSTPPSPGTPAMKERFLQYLSKVEFDEFLDQVKQDLIDKEITVKSYSAFISAEKY